MALYIGSSKQKINLSGIEYRLNLFSKIFTANDALLLSSDGYILKDSNGLYLTVKERALLISSDNCILKDSNGLYLTVKERD